MVAETQHVTKPCTGLECATDRHLVGRLQVESIVRQVAAGELSSDASMPSSPPRNLTTLGRTLSCHRGILAWPGP